MKKRLYACLLLAAALLMSFGEMALAASTKEEWDASCNWVISHSATLYSASYNDDVTTDTDLYTFTPIGTIAAGERVSIRSSANGMREIYYWNGGKRSAWVEDSAVRWDGGSSSGSSGSSGSVSTGTNIGGSSGSSSGRRRTTVTDTWEALDLNLIQEEGETQPVTLQVLGTAQCVVYDGKQLLTVPTEDLVWDTEADDDHRLAIIYAPKTGKATLRASASNKAKSIGQCEDGRIVVVLKVGSTYTRILYDGKEGCVLTAALTFTGSVPVGEFSTAELAYKGRTDTSATISVYTAKNAKRKIKQWRVGNEVVVISESGSWSEVEIDGWHGWVKSAYLE
ncbi:MAG: hypothetical protein IKK57_08590 [Clostridia bacterium]|nr:hypothetical protein [Clostridia bacterium]